MPFHRSEHQDHAMRELQAKTSSVVSGDTATTDIPVAGILTADTIGSVLYFTGGVPADVTSEASITTDGNIQLSTTDTSTGDLVVEWYPHVGSGTH